MIDWMQVHDVIVFIGVSCAVILVGTMYYVLFEWMKLEAKACKEGVE